MSYVKSCVFAIGAMMSVAGFVGSAAAQATSAAAEAEVRAVMDQYIKASSTGDEKAGRAIFHPNAVMSGSMVGSKINITTPESFFSHLARVAAKTEKVYGPAKILSASVNGEVATGSVEESNFDGVRYVESFQFVHENGKWLIISKIWTGNKLAP